MPKTLAYYEKQVDIAKEKLAVARDQLLGVESDAEVAKRHGVERAFVERIRVSLGVVSAQGRIDWESNDQYLGTMKDRILAGMIGCSPASIWKRRQKLGIPEFKGETPKVEKQERPEARIKPREFNWPKPLNWPRPNGREIDEARRGRLA